MADLKKVKSEITKILIEEGIIERNFKGQLLLSFSDNADFYFLSKLALADCWSLPPKKKGEE